MLQAHGKKQSSLVVGGSAGNNSQDASIEVFMADSKVSLTSDGASGGAGGALAPPTDPGHVEPP